MTWISAASRAFELESIEWLFATRGTCSTCQFVCPANDGSSSCNEHLAAQAMGIGGGSNLVAPKNNDWKFFEYCCASDSLLASWLQRHGVEVQRLGLPEHDMSNDDEAKKHTDEI